jgi:hypothetical protein
VKKTKPKRKAKVVDITNRRRELIDLTKFIDAHGGKLGAFRRLLRPRRHPLRGPDRCVQNSYLVPAVNSWLV